MKTIKITTLFLGMLCAIKAFSMQIDIDVTGLSYHIGANADNPAYSKAPRGLDNNGAFVFNPGVGIGIDFRKHSRDNCWHGFSPIIKGIYLRDCDDRSWAMFLAGTRYRYLAKDYLSFDFNLGISIVNSEEWSTNARMFNVNPYYSLGANYHFDNNATVGITGSLIPKNENAGDSISGFNILFLSLYCSFPL